MSWRKSYRHGLTAGMVAVFTIQIFAIAFCFIGQASAAPATVQPAMATACPMDMEAPDKDLPCTSCELPNTGTLAGGTGALSFDLPLLAILPDTWSDAETVPSTRAYELAQAQAPPRSTSLIYKTSLRIRL